MQLLITHGSMARTRVLQFQRWQLLLMALALVVALMAASGAIYHFIFLKAAREGWPVVSSLVRLVVRDEIAQRDRFMRENLDAMAEKVGEIQAKMVKLETLGERVSGLAGMKPDDVKPLQRRGAASAADGKGGPFVAAGFGAHLATQKPGLEELQGRVSDLDLAVDFNTDLFTYYDARLHESRLTALLVPSAAPVVGPIGSGFGFRTDPINGRSALHTGLDFPAEIGTPILAAAGGMVVTKEWHPGYGHVLEIDHGNGLLTRYAHCSSIDVEVGALVKRGNWWPKSATRVGRPVLTCTSRSCWRGHRRTRRDFWARLHWDGLSLLRARAGLEEQANSITHSLEARSARPATTAAHGGALRRARMLNLTG